jgi:hypothetical protein
MRKTTKERWKEIESKAWNELAEEGDLGRMRFTQRCLQIAKAAGWDEDVINIMLTGKPLTQEQKAARGGKK